MSAHPFSVTLYFRTMQEAETFSANASLVMISHDEEDPAATLSAMKRAKAIKLDDGKQH